MSERQGRQVNEGKELESVVLGMLSLKGS